MPITADQAWAATDPTQTDEERTEAAARMMAGVAANDAYLSSRPELEQLIAQAQGGQIVAHADINADSAAGGDLSGSEAKEIPTESGPQTVTGTVVPGSETSSEEATPDATGSDVSGGDSDTDKLRAQLLKYGITPDA